jgi:hypothetical protein
MAFAAEANHLRCPVTPESQIRPVSLHICNAGAERKYIREVVAMPSTKIVWEIRPSKHRHTFDLISNAQPFGRTGGYHYVAGAVLTQRLTLARSWRSFAFTMKQATWLKHTSTRASRKFAPGSLLLAVYSTASQLPPIRRSHSSRLPRKPSSQAVLNLSRAVISWRFPLVVSWTFR